jgi:hypothetical protein
MKHGPIALLDESTPVVVVATRSHVYDKMVSNIQEVRARGARDRDRDRRERRHPAPRRRCHLHSDARPHSSNRAGRRAAAAARLPDRAPARPERRSAAEPGEPSPSSGRRQ